MLTMFTLIITTFIALFSGTMIPHDLAVITIILDTLFSFASGTGLVIRFVDMINLRDLMFKLPLVGPFGHLAGAALKLLTVDFRLGFVLLWFKPAISSLAWLGRLRGVRDYLSSAYLGLIATVNLSIFLLYFYGVWVLIALIPVHFLVYGGNLLLALQVTMLYLFIVSAAAYLAFVFSFIVLLRLVERNAARNFAEGMDILMTDVLSGGVIYGLFHWARGPAFVRWVRFFSWPLYLPVLGMFYLGGLPAKLATYILQCRDRTLLLFRALALASVEGANPLVGLDLVEGVFFKVLYVFFSIARFGYGGFDFDKELLKGSKIMWMVFAEFKLFEVLGFVVYHFTHIPFVHPDAAPLKSRPALLRRRLFLTAISPVICLFKIKMILLAVLGFSFAPFILLFFLGRESTGYVALVSSQALWVATWCQTGPVRERLLRYRKGSVKRFSSWYLSLARWYLTLYMYLCRPGDSLRMPGNPIVLTYTVGSTVHSLHFRDDVPVDPEHVSSAFLHSLFSTNPAWEHFLLGSTVIILPVVVFIWAFSKSLAYNVRIFILYLKRLLWFNLAVWLAPDFVYVIPLGQFAILWDKLVAFMDTTDVLKPFRDFASVVYLSTLNQKDLVNPFRIPLKLDPTTRVRVLSAARVAALRIIRRFDDFRLPEFVEAQYMAPTSELIRESYSRLQALGFPVEQTFIDSIQSPDDEPYFRDWASAPDILIAKTNHVLGALKRAVGIPQEMSNWEGFVYLGQNYEGYIHTAFYNSVEAEIEATKRYFTGNNTLDHFPDDLKADLLDGAWAGVKAQFAQSSLASPEIVFKNWEKRFNLGFGFTKGFNASGKPRLIKRFEAIAKFGGRSEFLKAWKEVFREAPSYFPVAPVFAKMETLKVKKYVARAVRTVIGSAFTHHVMTTVFNYLPNHNYHIWDTPMKVGMSFNGQTFGRLWDTLIGHEFVWAGDMTAFDSTVPPAIVRLAGEVRKMGFSTHADFHRIATLIDISYEQLLRHPLGFRATGTIVSKDQGFTTGHSSTSPDNSIALLIAYLYAWRRVTGLRTREFFNYNSLSNFGDDHILSWDAVFGWTPERAAEAMKELGIIMRDEAPNTVVLPSAAFPTDDRLLLRYSQVRPMRPGPDGSPVRVPFADWKAGLLMERENPMFSKFSFLAKVALPVTGRVKEDLDKAGVTLPYSHATAHDPLRLIGKIKGQMFTNTHPIIRRKRLLSYMSLCAHHEDVYEQLLMSIQAIDRKYNRVWQRSGEIKSLDNIPSYMDVVRKWYNPKVHVKILDPGESVLADLEDKELLDELVLVAGPPSFSDTAVRWLADFPTIFAPRRVGLFWSEWIIAAAPRFFDWPLQLLALSNGLKIGSMGVRDLAETLPYRIVVHPRTLSPSPNPPWSTLLLRHYIFSYVHSNYLAVKRTPGLFDVLDLLDHSLANLSYLVLGRPLLVARQYVPELLSLFLIVILNYVSINIPFIDNHYTQICAMPIPSVSFILDSIWYSIRRTLNPLGAVDTQPWIAEVRQRMVDHGGSIVSAPTGAGKSTTLVSKAVALGIRVVVVVPRLAVARALVDWMSRLNPDISIGGAGEGLKHKHDDSIIYSTPLAALGQNLLGADDRKLVILDEAHVDEPLYHVILAFLRRTKGVNYVLMTATPLDSWPEPRVVIPAVPRFSIKEFTETGLDMRDYQRFVVGKLRNLLPHQRALVFFPSKAICDDFAVRFPDSAVLYSGVQSPSDSARLFFSTSVADAGLTIPDVEVVISSDVDVFVTVHRGDISREDPHAIPFTRQFLYFRLSPQTIRQRRGRTGRTCDGEFFLYELAGLKLSPRTFSNQDYLDSLGQLVGAYDSYVPGLTQYVRENLVTNRPIGESWQAQIVSTWSATLADLQGMMRAITATEILSTGNINNEKEIIYLADFELPEPEQITVPFNPADGPDLPDVEATMVAHALSMNYEYIDPETGEPTLPANFKSPEIWGINKRGVGTGADFVQKIRTLFPGVNYAKVVHFAAMQTSMNKKMFAKPFNQWTMPAKNLPILVKLVDTWWETQTLAERTSFGARRVETQRPEPPKQPTASTSARPAVRSTKEPSPADQEELTLSLLVGIWRIHASSLPFLCAGLKVSSGTLVQIFNDHRDHPFFRTPLLISMEENDYEYNTVINTLFPGYPST